MALLMAGLALFVAFVSLWLANSAMNKVESQFNEFSKNVIREAKAAKQDMERQVSDVSASVQTLERKVETLNGGIAGANERIKQIEQQLISAIKVMREMESALPVQYRRKTARKPKEKAS